MFDIANGQPFVDNSPRDRVGIFHRKQCTRMTGGNRPLRDKTPAHFWKVEQAHGVGDMGATFSDDFGEFRLGIAKVSAKPLIAPGLFDSVEVGALHVFNNRQLQRLAIIGFVDNHRDIRESRQAARRANAFHRR